MTSVEKTQKEAADWFAAQRRGPMSLQERQAFDAWRADPLNQAALNRMHEVWGELAGVGRATTTGRGKTVRPHRLAAAAGLAASVLLATSLGLWSKLDRASTQTGIGEQRSQQLADGSLVALNVVTRARYDINARERVVHLAEGEATFVVQKDTERPFLVRTGGYEVWAVGTAFNVRNRDRMLDVAVKEGVVEVRRLSGGAKPVRLRAGERVRISDGASPRAILAVTSVPTTAVDEWRQRVLTYEDAPIEQVLRDLNRFYERPISADAALGRRHVTLRLVVDDRAETLKRLAALLGAEVKTAGAEERLTG